MQTFNLFLQKSCVSYGEYFKSNLTWKMDQHHEPSISPTQGVGAPVSSATTTTATSKAPEFEPPQACVSRIIKNVLPENIQLTKEARAAFTRAAGTS